MNDKVTEVLEKAIDVLNENGWCQGKMHDANGAVCAMGALDMAALSLGAYPDVLDLEGEAVKRMSRAAGTPCMAFNGTRFVQHSIPSWNDQPGRTVEDVILMFKHAAHDGSSS